MKSILEECGVNWIYSLFEKRNKFWLKAIKFYSSWVTFSSWVKALLILLQSSRPQFQIWSYRVTKNRSLWNNKNTIIDAIIQSAFSGQCKCPCDRTSSYKADRDYERNINNITFQHPVALLTALIRSESWICKLPVVLVCYVVTFTSVTAMTQYQLNVMFTSSIFHSAIIRYLERFGWRYNRYKVIDTTMRARGNDWTTNTN
jgi:hypothetical protein